MTIDELAELLTPVAEENNATIIIPSLKKEEIKMEERDALWKNNAKFVENVYGGFVDWEEEFYECPCCGEPVYLCDWNAKAFDEFICPICEDEDLKEE